MVEKKKNQERPGISGHELNPGSFERDWITAERIRRFVRVCDQKGIREIRDVKIARVKIDEDAKDSMNPFGSRSQVRTGSTAAH
jgi:hypothetical protein